MTRKTTLNARNLETLGAARLAELLMELSRGNAAAKQQLRLALAGQQGADEIAREIRKRLTSIARARTFITWKNRKPLLSELDTHLDAILERIAPKQPKDALELLWRFLSIANPLFERCDDSSGLFSDIFRQACDRLGELAVAADANAIALAEKVFSALQSNNYGQYDELITILAPALHEEGLAHLQAEVEKLAATPVAPPPPGEWEVVAWGANGPTYAHDFEARHRRRMVEMALQDIADARGDVDAFIAQVPPDTRRVPAIAAGIAQRLLRAGRPEEALACIRHADTGGRSVFNLDYHDAHIAALEALDRHQEAQTMRLDLFRNHLWPEMLRAYLRRLPNHEDIDAEEAALEHVMAYPGAVSALHFLIHWPAKRHAAELVVRRASALDGDHYEILAPAAETLADAHPLASTLLRRAMIDFALTEARYSRYGHAARDLGECEQLAERIDDWNEYESHETYCARLKKTHGRKTGFWSRVSDVGAGLPSDGE